MCSSTDHVCTGDTCNLGIYCPKRPCTPAVNNALGERHSILGLLGAFLGSWGIGCDSADPVESVQKLSNGGGTEAMPLESLWRPKRVSCSRAFALSLPTRPYRNRVLLTKLPLCVGDLLGDTFTSFMQVCRPLLKALLLIF